MTRLVALLLAAATLAGCAVKPKPPKLNLYPRLGVAILPVVNRTKDAALGLAVRDRLAAALKALGPVPLADPDRVGDAAAAAPAPAASPWTDAALRRRVADATGCDWILAVTVEAYRDDFVSETPRRVRSDFAYDTFRWGWADTGSARVDLVLRVVDAGSGRIVRTLKADAEISRSRWTDVAWPGDRSEPPKTGWDSLKRNARPAGERDASGLWWPAEPLVADARDGAIAEAVHGLLPEFRGRDGWRPPAATAAR
jgi:hypothetical protein